MVQEFQVIIFAGGAGNRMYPLTEGIPKNMLPVANRPLISYQLELLERVGISDAIIIVNSDDAPELQQYVSEMYKGKLKVSFEIFKGRIGTAEALLRVKDKIKSNNFIVVSGDLIVQEGFLHSMADIHRTRDAALTVLLKKIVPTENEEQQKTSKSKEPNFHDFIGLSEDGRLLYLAAAADLDENMIIRKSLLKRFPNMTIYTSLLDSHFYIFSKWVLDFLETQEHITSLKGELIPELLELQVKKAAEGFDVPKELLFETDSPSYSSSAKHEINKLGCFAYVQEGGFCARVNTIPSYLEANREIAKGTTGFLPWETLGKGNFVESSAEVNPKTQVGPECIVGAFTQVGEKCSIKKSIIGKHCKIGNNVKIINSVIMNHVTILDKCTIQNSLVCHNAHLGDSCSITNCQVGVSFSLQAKSDHKNESLVSEMED